MTTTSCTCFLPVRRILCATDFSDGSSAAFHVAVQLCSALEARLTVLNVFEYANLSAPEDGGRLLVSDAAFKDADLSVNILVQEAESAGVVCEGTMATGLAHTCIADAQTSGGFDLVVLGTRSIHGFERLVFGSTAEAVLRASSCPVLTVGPLATNRDFTSRPEDGIVLFATDFHVTTTAALRYAAYLATKLHLQLHCLHVLPQSVVDTIHEGVIPMIIKEGLQHLTAGLDDTCRTPVCAVTYGSEVSHAVVEYARVHPTHLIVLGVRRAPLMASHVPARITYRIIAEAPCAVITIAFAANDLSKTSIALKDSQHVVRTSASLNPARSAASSNTTQH